MGYGLGCFGWNVMGEFLCDVGVGEVVDLVVWFGEEVDCDEVGFIVYVELMGGVVWYGD